MSNRIEGRYDTLVVGGGGIGLSTAYHLARLGQAVLLIDKGGIASGTSARAAGMLALLTNDQVRSAVVRRSVDKITAFEDESGVALPYTQAGTLRVARDERCADYVRADIARGLRMGVAVRLVDHKEARELAPVFAPQKETVVSYAPEDLYFEPEAILNAYIQAGKAAGVDMRPQCTLVGLEADSRGTRAITSCGDVVVKAVVDAAGAWASLIASKAGQAIPVVPTRHQLVVTEPIEMVRNGQPAVTIVDDNVYTRPCRGGLLVGGFEPEPVQMRSEDITSSFTIEDLELDDRPVHTMRTKVSDLIPSLAVARVAELRGGVPTITSDYSFIVDRISDKLNTFVVTGCCVWGLSTSMCIGEALAARVNGDQPRIELSKFGLARFPSMQNAFDDLAEKAAWQYSHHLENESVA